MATAWTIATLLASLRDYLANRQLPTARLDAELLLAHVLGQPRIYLYTHFDQPVSEQERASLRALAVRRAAHEPIAYILGEQEFYGHALYVDRRVLIPRPESELLVEAACRFLRRKYPPAPALALAATVAENDGPPSPALPRPAVCAVLDIGTGSGALAVAIAKGEPRAHVLAVDISEEALAVAAQNVQRHGLQDRISLLQLDLQQLATARDQTGSDASAGGSGPAAAVAGWLQALLPERTAFDVIVSNPPYIGQRERDTLPTSVVAYEPALALFAGEGGSALLEAVARAAPAWLGDEGLLAMELAPAQVTAARLACAPWCEARIGLDLAGLERLCLAGRGQLWLADT